MGWAILLMAAFILFMWGSGMRAMSTYPDPQWVFGLLGLAAFGAVLLTGKRYLAHVTPGARFVARSQS